MTNTITSAALALRLIRSQFPQLKAQRLEHLGAGWDNDAYLLDGETVFRFPRRPIAVDLIRTEIAYLPRLAPQLPLPVPVPLYNGEPGPEYPWPFCGHRLVPGTTACRISWQPEERARCAADIARFLSTLHSVPVTEEDLASAPRDTIGRTDLPSRLPNLRERLPRIENRLRAPGYSAEQVMRLADELSATARNAEPACWVHGDLYARHLLADENRRLCGVIDWGDLHLGDRSLDLAIVISFLPRRQVEEFEAAYGAVDESMWRRARFRALHYAVILLDYGASVQDEAMVRAGEFAMDNAMELGS